MAVETLTDTREQVHALVDYLPPAQLSAVRGLLETMIDPVSLSILNAPVEDEEITPALAAELDAANEAIERGAGIPHEEFLRRLNLTQG